MALLRWLRRDPSSGLLTKRRDEGSSRVAVFHTLVDEGTMSKAGDRLFISQPAVSAHIKALEDALGMPLFDRIGRRSVVNYAGRLLYRNAERLFSAADDLAEAMEDLRGTSSGTLRLGMSHVSQYWLSPTLAAFRSEYPNVGLSASVANSGQLERMVLDRTVDIAITAQVPRRAEIKSLAVAADRLVPVCPPGHAEAGPHEVGTAVLKGETLVIREAGSASRAAFDELAEKAGIDVLASVELGSEEAIRQVVASGHGVGMVSERGASCDLASGRLDIVDDPTLCAPLRVHVIHHAARVLTFAHRAFMDTLASMQAIVGPIARLIAARAALSAAVSPGSSVQRRVVNPSVCSNRYLGLRISPPASESLGVVEFDILKYPQ